MNRKGQRTRAGLEDRLRFESLLANLTARFVNLPPAEVKGEIDGALRELCELLDLDRSTLWIFDDPLDDEARLRHHYQIRGGPDIPSDVRSSILFPWVREQALKGDEIVLETMDELPDRAAVDRESFRHYESKSVVVLPLRVGGRSIGIVSFATLRKERSWPEVMVTRLRLCAQVFADAIARRRFDLALRASEQRLSLALDSAGAGLWSMDLETQSVWANPRLREMYGFGPGEELVYESFLRTIHPDDRDRVRQAVQASTESDVSLEVEYRLVMEGGGIRWLSAHGRRQTVTDGGIGRLIGLTYDITRQRQAEEVLRSLNRRLIQAHEDERSHLARELHDDLTQRLARLAIDLGRLDRLESPDDRRSNLGSVREDLARLSEDVHTLAYRLHPTILDDLGLAEALRSECDRFALRESIAVEQDLGEVPDSLPREVSLCLFRVAQECLRNVARHAQAKRISVTVAEGDEGVRLTVEDDGSGFEPTLHPEAGHLGIVGMRERVHLVSGSFQITSSLGDGTTVRAWVPLGRGSR